MFIFILCTVLFNNLPKVHNLVSYKKFILDQDKIINKYFFLFCTVQEFLYTLYKFRKGERKNIYLKIL